LPIEDAARTEQAMAIEVKICGINTVEAMAAATGGGAGLVGLVFYPPSPRCLRAAEAAALTARVPPAVVKVGVFVDPDDAFLRTVLGQVPIELVQLHGSEAPDRVAEIKRRFGRPVMKAIKVAEPADLDAADRYLQVADRLLFDAKPPKRMTDALPGGNAVSFDWRLLAGRSWRRPWMLSGGLDLENLAEAVEISGARAVDVSSGVEDRPGVKDPAKIAAFLEAARALDG
jgi:phosphoribosylanthranilate isomerase